jgi:hypothetical protein
VCLVSLWRHPLSSVVTIGDWCCAISTPTGRSCCLTVHLQVDVVDNIPVTAGRFQGSSSGGSSSSSGASGRSSTAIKQGLLLSDPCASSEFAHGLAGVWALPPRHEEVVVVVCGRWVRDGGVPNTLRQNIAVWVGEGVRVQSASSWRCRQWWCSAPGGAAGHTAY